MKKLLAMILAISMLGGCGTTDKKNKDTTSTSTTTLQSILSTTEKNIPPPVLTPVTVKNISTFSDYVPYNYTGTPSVPEYTISANLDNVINRWQYTTEEKPEYDVEEDYTDQDGNPYIYQFYRSDYEMSEEMQKLIEENGFAVSDRYDIGRYSTLYEENRYDLVPNFITTDTALYSFHLVFSSILVNLEKNIFYNELNTLTTEMYNQAEAMYYMAEDTDFENAALRNYAYFAVANSLLNTSFEFPAEISDICKEEITLINNASGPAPSPIVNLGENNDSLEEFQLDYSQFTPRSHYTETEELQKYFRVMQWYGQTTYRSKYEDEAKSAILMTALLYTSQTALDSWMKIYEPTNFFVGDSDDIIPQNFYTELSEIYGDFSDFTALTNNENFEKAKLIIRAMKKPAINSTPIYETVEDVDKAIVGLRFMGQRFTVDGAIMQQLMDRLVPDRALPSALDIPSAFGSNLAEELQKDETSQYPEYQSQLDFVREKINALPEETWGSNVYWGWLNNLRPLTDDTKSEGYPLFMQNQLWEQKELNTFISSWTELKHDTALYIKQPMGEMGGGIPDEPETAPDDGGYVEPNPNVYGRLLALTNMTLSGMESRGLFFEEKYPEDRDISIKSALEKLQYLYQNLLTISEHELANTPLTTEEYDFIRTFGGELEHVWDVYHYNHPNVMMGNNTNTSLVIDVATDPNGLCLEEGVGYGKLMIAAFPRNGEVVLGSGVVYSHYEFTQPLDHRLTDEEWQFSLSLKEMPFLVEYFESVWSAENNPDDYAEVPYYIDIPEYSDWQKDFIADIGFLENWELEELEQQAQEGTEEDTE
ncbi:MAG: DUF3160 domain-containing protein [Oscillospiraceae bacterium]|jgi:hypothetical protein|nr:DUF3160 domain-containing protein [Oscillospiraceae bacterium]